MMYPDAKKMVAYGEFRAPFEKDKKDHRFVCYGIRYIIDTYVNVRWTMADVEKVLVCLLLTSSLLASRLL